MRALAPEEIYPVCGVSYVARFGRPATVEDLLSHRLIHHEEPFRPTVTWSEWFASAGIGALNAPKGLRINDYVLVIQSVIEGPGYRARLGPSDRRSWSTKVSCCALPTTIC
jgi:DNA-binding transcriptional LysR family regulator